MRPALTLWTVAVIIGVLAASPGTASGSVARLAFEEPIPGLDPETAYALSVTAEAGEANAVTVARTVDGYTVTDAIGITAGPGCASVDAERVECPTPQPADAHSVFVDVGDLADRVELGDLKGAMAEARGGAGPDLILGGPQGDILVGGAGPDRIASGDGNDQIDGGRGDDLIDGGSGTDRLSYQTRTEGVSADLATGVGTSAGEKDRFFGIEELIGGRGLDRLYGDAGPNTLIAGEAGPRDLAVGRGGDDALIADRVRGGPGNDRLDGRKVSCGSGHDVIYRGQFHTRGPFGKRCEAALAVLIFLAAHPERAGRKHVDIAVRCRFEVCKGRLALADRKGRLGSARYSLSRDADGDTAAVRIKLKRQPVQRLLRLSTSGRRAYQRDWFRLRLRVPG